MLVGWWYVLEQYILRTNLQGSSILEELKLWDSCGLVIVIRSCIDFIFFPAL